MSGNMKAALHLAEMNIHDAACSLIRSKAGISVYRVTAGSRNFVLKVFDNAADAREIANYLLLQRLGICTLPLLGHTADAILLPDVDASSEYRLGIREDLSDPEVAEAIAKWYRALHSKGAQYIAAASPSMYDETDVLTAENMRLVAEKTGTAKNPLWLALEAHDDEIRGKISALPRTLTYNDFYYTNLIVSKDKTSAFMFDYNLLGKGTAYVDIRNVTSSLSPEAAGVFCGEYGVTGMEDQKTADEVLSHLVTLYFACCTDAFPSWAKESLEKLTGGELLNSLMKWIK